MALGISAATACDDECTPAGRECDPGSMCADRRCVLKDVSCPEFTDSVCVGDSVHHCLGSMVAEEGAACFDGQRCVDVEGEPRQGRCVVDEEPCEVSGCQGNVGRECVAGFATRQVVCGEGERCALSYVYPECAAAECPEHLEFLGCWDGAVVDCATGEVENLVRCPANTTCERSTNDAWCLPDAGIREHEWVAIPGGEVPPFEILATEVTRGQYQACIDAEICDWGGCLNLLQVDGRLPARCVGDYAERYCSWLNARLPTLAEWRYALGNAGALGPYPWGDGTPKDCSTAVVYGSDTRPETRCDFDAPQVPCSHSADITAQGVCDLVGNLRELVLVTEPGTLNQASIGASFAVSETEFERAMQTPIVGYDLGTDVGFRCVR